MITSGKFFGNFLVSNPNENRFISKIRRLAYLSWISTQQKLALARNIVVELRQMHAHEKYNEGELPDFSDKKVPAKS